ncbi:MAG: polysaccharide export protein [Minwuia sp.]|nr:polysaccharide export protein [Minwuia sp.]
MRQNSFRRFAIAMLALGAVAVVAQGCSDRRYERVTSATATAPVAQQRVQPALVAPAPAAVPQRRVLAAPETVIVRPTPQVAPAPQTVIVQRPALTVPDTTIVTPQSRTAVVTPSVSGAALADPDKPAILIDELPTDVAQKLEQYRLGPGDRIQIKVFGQDDISGEFEISAAGELSVPLIGQITAENLTLGELAQVLTTALDTNFIVDPKVSIEVTNYRPFFILGQVGKPGSYKYQPGLNARMAVAVGGGYTRRAREEPITIFRTNSAGELVRFRVDQNAIILPGDTVEVHRRLF